MISSWTHLWYNLSDWIRTEVFQDFESRMRHTYIIWKSWTGKSVLQVQCASSDIKNDKWIIVIDPHGELVDDILKCVPEKRKKDVVLIDPVNYKNAVSINFLDENDPTKYSNVAEEIIKIMKVLYWEDAIKWVEWQYITNIIKLLLYCPNENQVNEYNKKNWTKFEYLWENYWKTLLDFKQIINDDNYRTYKLIGVEKDYNLLNF